MAFANPLITAYAVEATETVVNETIEILGGLPQDLFVEQALQPPA